MYTIRMRESKDAYSKLAAALGKALIKSRFTVGSIDDLGIRWNKRTPTVHVALKCVRLKTAKAYCGQHPGNCVLGDKRKPHAKYLEWEDWVFFHNLVNDVLDLLGIYAEVWSTPFDVKGKMWIRKNNKRRTHYDWTENERGVRVWNPGTEEDQYRAA